MVFVPDSIHVADSLRVIHHALDSLWAFSARDTLKILQVGGKDPWYVQAALQFLAVLLGGGITVFVTRLTLRRQEETSKQLLHEQLENQRKLFEDQLKAQHDLEMEKLKEQHKLELEKIKEQTKAQYAIAVFEARLEAYDKLRHILKPLYRGRAGPHLEHPYRVAYASYESLDAFVHTLLQEGRQLHYLLSNELHACFEEIKELILQDSQALSSWIFEQNLSMERDREVIDNRTNGKGMTSNAAILELLGNIDDAIARDMDILKAESNVKEA